MDKTTKEALHEHVLKWMTDVMQFKGYNGTYSDNEDLKLLCAGSNEKIWKHIINTVRPIKEVKNIRGNLSLQSSISNEGIDEDLKYLMEKRDRLQKQLVTEEETVGMMELDNNWIKKELVANEYKLKSQTASLTMECHSKRLKKIFSENIAKHAKRMNALMHEVERKSFGSKNILRNSNDPEVIQDEGSQSDDRAMDRKCYVETKKCCLLVEEYIQSTVKMVQNLPDNESDRPLMLKQLMDPIKELINNYSAEEINTSLVKIVSQSNHRLQNLTISKHSEISRENCEMLDGLLQDVKLKMMNEYAEIEGSLNKSFALEKQNERMEEILLDLLEQKYQNSTARSLYEVMKRSRVSQVIRSSHEKELARLQQKMEKLKRDHDEIVRGCLDLRNFQEIMEIDFNIAHQLVKEIHESRHKFRKLQTEVTEFVSKNLIGQKEKWVTVVEASNLLGTKEINLFLKIDLNDIQYFSNQSQASIHGLLDNNCWPFSHLLSEILDVLKFPLYLSFDEILCHVSSLISMIWSSGNRTAEGTNYFCDLGNMTHQLNALKMQITEKEKSYIEMLPFIDHSFTNAKMLESLPIGKTLSDWWDQPAQNQVPWFKINGLSFQEYLDEWKVHASNLRLLAIT